MDNERDLGAGGKEPTLDPEAEARREFLIKLTKVGATVPAVALLLAANFKTAAAQAQYGGGGSGSGSGGGSGSGSGSS
jgi:hypothetical protein